MGIQILGEREYYASTVGNVNKEVIINHIKEK